MIDKALRTLLLSASVLVFGGSVVSFLASGCIVTTCDDDDDDFDDDDDYCDDDDDDHTHTTTTNTDSSWHAIAAAETEVFVLEEFTVAADTQDGRWEAHGFAEIRGLSMLRVLAEPSFTPEALRVFGDRVLSANRELIGVPAARQRRFEGIVEAPGGFWLSYAFEQGRVRLFVDEEGSLTTIERLAPATKATAGEAAVAPR